MDGRNPFADVAPDWRGFDPGVMLGPDSPLIPESFGRRVALQTCSCGEAGCGVIAPLVVASPDGRAISWADFRDYVGVFSRPTVKEHVDDSGTPWNLDDIHFDRDQYLTEVARASDDRAWETPRRALARLVMEILRPMNLVLPANLGLAWASPAWSEEGVDLMFQHVPQDPALSIEQQLLHLSSDCPDPADAARDMADRLLSELPDDWVRLFGTR